MNDFSKAQHVSLLVAAADLARTTAPPGRSLAELLQDVKAVHASLLTLLADQTHDAVEDQPVQGAAGADAAAMEAEDVAVAGGRDAEAMKSPQGFITLWDDTLLCQNCGKNFKRDSIIDA